MIEIDEPPDVRACASCMSAISWLYSARNKTWFAVVRVDDDTMRIHRCRLELAGPSWRAVPKGDPPNGVYLAARAALSTPPDTKEDDVTTSLITIWHCDANCDATAPENTDGWADVIYTHGCPTHADLIAAHKADKTYDTRGRGYREKTTWYLSCACGWRPAPYYASHTANALHVQHVAHVRAAASCTEPEETTT